MTTHRNQNPKDSPLDWRMQELENVTVRLTSESASTRADIERLSHSFDRFAQQVSDWMRSSGRPNWGWFIGLGALILSIMGLAASPFLRDLQRVEAHTTAVAGQLNAMSNSQWTREDHVAFDAKNELERNKLEALILDGLRDLRMQLEDHTSDGHSHTLRAHIDSLKLEIDKISEELVARQGRRFDWEDYDKYVLPELKELRSMLKPQPDK